MSQIHDELAARAMLTDLTEGQPPAPADRFGAVRRRAALHRRRQLAAIAAVIAVLAAAAATIPLRLLHPAAPPAAPNRYHLSEQPPARGARPGLIATGTIDGRQWRFTVEHEPGSSHLTALCTIVTPGTGMSCAEGEVQAAPHDGPPADISLGQQWGRAYLDLGTVRRDVTSLQVRYTNGQTLTVYPVSAFGSRSAKYVVLVTPRSGSVLSVTAFAGQRELGYAIPVAGQPGVNLVRWLGPGHPALPRPIVRLIGAGSTDGTSWTANVAIGPWGTCLYTSGGGSDCYGSNPKLPAGTIVSADGGISVLGSVRIYSGQTAASVSYLVVNMKDHSTARVRVVSVGSLRYFACADVRGDRIVRWAAYDAAGRMVYRSKSGQIP